MDNPYKKIIPIHYKLSKPVESFGEVKKMALKVRDFMDTARYEGYWNKAFAIAHCQVDETPYAFFVVAEEVLEEKMFPSRIIINPRVIERETMRKLNIVDPHTGRSQSADIPNIVIYEEACMSFPFRQPKKIERFDYIKIRYQIPTAFGGLKTIEEYASGIKSQIFQHETEHCNAQNVYFYPKKPVAWWELIGTERPALNGSSLDRKAMSEEAGVVSRGREAVIYNETS